MFTSGLFPSLPSISIHVYRSHGKQHWANQSPMNTEEFLIDQVNTIIANRPDTVVMIYRNTVKALSWFTYVQTKVNDPMYAGYFLSFRNDTNDTVSPKCDINTSPLKCTNLYHDQMQSPQYKVIDDGQNGTCYPLPCDAGNVPSGEYLFDFRNASARGYIIEDMLGPSCFGNDNVSGVYLDDYWINTQQSVHPDWNQPPWGYCDHSITGGPSEIQLNCSQDMQLTQNDVNGIYSGWQTSMNAIYNAMGDAGVFAYQSFSFISTPGSSSSIQSSLQSACAAGNSSNYYNSPIMHTFTTPPSCCPATRNTTLLQFNEDLAFFMLVRGPSAYLGYGWDFCSPYHEMPPALFVDYGDPLDTCQESQPNYFTRQYSNATVWFNTTSYTGGIN